MGENKKEYEELKAEMHVITPTFTNCNFKLINKVYESFVPDPEHRQQKFESIKIYHPNQKQVNKIVSEEKTHTCREELFKFRQKVIGSYQKGEEKHFFKDIFGKNYSEDQNFFEQFDDDEYFSQSEDQFENQEFYEDLEDIRGVIGLYNYRNHFNPRHRNEEKKKLVMPGFSIPHLKAFCIFYRDREGKIDDNKNIFMFGSHNMSKTAWQENDFWRGRFHKKSGIKNI